MTCVCAGINAELFLRTTTVRLDGIGTWERETRIEEYGNGQKGASFLSGCSFFADPISDYTVPSKCSRTLIHTYESHIISHNIFRRGVNNDTQGINTVRLSPAALHNAAETKTIHPVLVSDIKLTCNKSEFRPRSEVEDHGAAIPFVNVSNVMKMLPTDVKGPTQTQPKEMADALFFTLLNTCLVSAAQHPEQLILGRAANTTIPLTTSSIAQQYRR